MRILILLFLFWTIYSCSSSVKNEKSLYKEQVVSNYNIHKIFVAEKTLDNQNDWNQYLKDNSVIILTNYNGKEIVAVETALFTGIKPVPTLTKNISNMMSYLAGFHQIDSSLFRHIENKQIQIGGYIPENALILCGDKKSIESLPGIKWICGYQPYMKIQKNDLKTPSGRFRINFWYQTDAFSFKTAADNMNIHVISYQGKDCIIETADIRPFLHDEAIIKVEKYHEPSLFSISGGKAANTVFNIWMTNQNETSRVSVFDMGLDNAHPDFNNTINQVFDLAGDGDTREFVAHGTHITGVIAGRGSASAGRISGVNDSARILFFAMEDSLKGLVVPTSLKPWLELSLQNRSFIANMSWGTYNDAHNGAYLSISKEIDDFIYHHPEMIIVTAVGNDGNSIASPASAKNVISVGALNGLVIAPYSGRNGTYDGRIKPEIVIQGTGIEAPGQNGVYEVKSGTSQAAALMTGIISRLYSVLETEYKIRPTHSLIKALLTVNTTDKSVNPETGFGRFYIDKPLNALHYSISHYSAMESFKTIKRTVNSNDTLSVVLCWTDMPGNENALYQLVNNLDLTVTAPDGQVITINDAVNNIERLVITNTKAGVYSFQIKAVHTPFEVPDATLVIKSDQGFIPEDKLPADNTPVYNIPYNTAEYSGFQFVPGELNLSAGHDDPISFTASDNGFSDGSSYQTPNSINYSNPLENLQSLTVETNQRNTASVTNVLYVKNGTNRLNIRILGVTGYQLINTEFTVKNYTTQINLPVQAARDSDYHNLSIFIPEGYEELEGQLLFQEPDSGSKKIVPVWFHVDTNAPVTNGCYPYENGSATNQAVWLKIFDYNGKYRSGVSSEMKIAVNGQIISNDQFDYSYSTGKLTLFLDRIEGLIPGNTVSVSLMKISDISGNIMLPVHWQFFYKPVVDNNPPQKPQGLLVRCSNKMITVSWLSNNENDLAGYNLYELDQDGLIKKRLTSGTFDLPLYKFTATELSGVGLTAFDIYTNESELTLYQTGYRYINSLPEILLTGIPDKTNSPFEADLEIRDEGIIVSSNIRIIVNGRTSAVQWDGYKIRFDDNGTNQLLVSVTDDEGNTVSNNSVFIIDSTAPETPTGLKWEIEDEMNVKLSWDTVLKNGRNCRYKVFSGTNEIFITGQTNCIVTNSDYGLRRYSVRAIDETGNESSDAVVVADTSTGLNFDAFPLLTNNTVFITARVRLPLDAFDVVRMIVSNDKENIVITGNRLSEPHTFEFMLDTKLLADGVYTVRTECLKQLNELKVIDIKRTNLTIDKKPPVIRFITDSTNIVPEGLNQLVVSTTNINLSVNDHYFEKLFLTYNNNPDMEMAVQEIDLDFEKLGMSGLLTVKAYDKAGNYTARSMEIIVDQDSPILRAGITNGMLYLNMRDQTLESYKVITNDAVYTATSSLLTTEFQGAVCRLPQGILKLRIEVADRAFHTNTLLTNITNMDSRATNILNGILVNGNNNYYQNSSSLIIHAMGVLEDAVNFSVWSGGRLVLSSGLISTNLYSLNGISDGLYTVKADCGPLSAELPILLDATAPLVRMETNLVCPTVLSDFVTVRDSNLLTIEYQLNGKSVETGEIVGAGFHQLAVTARDLTGNSTVVTNHITVADSFSNIMVYLFTGATNLGHYKRPVILGSRDNLPNVEYYVNGIKTPGVFSNDGIYTVIAKGWTGGLTNLVFTNAITFTVDTIRPVLVTEFQESSFTTTLPYILIDDRNLKGVITQLDGRPYNDEDPEIGYHRIRLTAYDYAGNTNSLETGFIFDNVKPLVRFTPASGYYSSVKPVMSTDDTYLSNALVYVNGHLTNQGFQLQDEGTYIVDFVASDKAGNVTAIARQYIIDRSSPELYINLQDGVTYQTNTLLTYSATDPDIQSKEALLNGLNTGGESVLLTNKGEYTFSFSAMDKAGNRAATNISFTVSDELPTLYLTGLPVLSNGGVYYTENALLLKALVTNGTLTEMDFRVNGTVMNNPAVIEKPGEYTIRVNALAERLGNSYRIIKEWRVILDKDAPVVFIGGFTNTEHYSNRILVSVAAGNNIKSLKVIVNGENVPSSFIAETDGVYQISAVAVDMLDRTNTALSMFTVDRTPPMIALSGIREGAGYNPGVNYAAAAVDMNLSNVSVYCNGGMVPLSGSLTMNGPNVLTVAAYDKAGNAAITNIRFWVDNIIPLVEMPGYHDYMSVKRLTNTLKIFDHYLDFYDIVISSAQGYYKQIVGGSNTNLSLSFLTNQGDYTVNVRVRDRGNNSNFMTYRFSIDTDSPVFNVSPVTNNGYFAYEPIITYSQSDKHNDTLLAWLNGSPCTNGVKAAGEGIHSLRLLAVDKAGNTNDTTIRFTVDMTYPDINIYGITNGSWYNTTRSVSISVLEIHPGTTECLYNGLPVNTAFTAIDQTNVYDTLRVTARDLAGNTSVTNLEFVIDTQPPALVYHVEEIPTSRTVDSNSINGLHFQSCIINIQTNDPHPAYLSNTVNGVLTARVYTNTAEGLYTNIVNAGDTLGNRVAVTNIYRIDNTRPVITVHGITNNGYYKDSLFITNILSDTYLNGPLCFISNYTGLTSLYNGFSITQAVVLSAETVNAYKYLVSAVDYAGNVTESNYQYTLDRTPPTAGLSNINPGQAYSMAILHIYGQDNAGGSGLYGAGYTITGATNAVFVTNGILSFPFTVTFGLSSNYPAPGTYNVAAYTLDRCGNPSAATNISFAIDNTPPAVSWQCKATNQGDGFYTNMPINRVDVNDCEGMDVLITVSDPNRVTNIKIYANNQSAVLTNISGIDVPSTNIRIRIPFDWEFTVRNLYIETSDGLGNTYASKPAVPYKFDDRVPPTYTLIYPGFLQHVANQDCRGYNNPFEFQVIVNDYYGVDAHSAHTGTDPNYTGAVNSGPLNPGGKPTSITFKYNITGDINEERFYKFYNTYRNLSGLSKDTTEIRLLIDRKGPNVTYYITHNNMNGNPMFKHIGNSAGLVKCEGFDYTIDIKVSPDYDFSSIVKYNVRLRNHFGSGTVWYAPAWYINQPGDNVWGTTDANDVNNLKVYNTTSMVDPSLYVNNKAPFVSTYWDDQTANGHNVTILDISYSLHQSYILPFWIASGTDSYNSIIVEVLAFDQFNNISRTFINFALFHWGFIGNSVIGFN